MLKNLPRFYLISQSPRRKQILENSGITVKVVHPNIEEIEPSIHDVREATMENAIQKASSYQSKLLKSTDILIGADTLVVLKSEILGKPKNKKEAALFLSKLSGKKHTVMSSVALSSKKWGLRVSLTESVVYFRTLSKGEINDYISTKEPYDKAGSYAVQGMGAIFIDKIEGSYTNVMGFPLETFLKEVPIYTGIPLKRWFL